MPRARHVHRYDHLGRLVEVDDGSIRVLYRYDDAGNRTSVEIAPAKPDTTRF